MSWLALALAAALVAAPAALADARDAVRQQRAELRQRADAERLDRIAEAERIIGDLIDQAQRQPVAEARDDLTVLAAGLYRLGSDQALPLMRRIDALPEQPQPDAVARANWTRQLAQARQKLTQRPLELLQRASAMGVIDIARRLLDEVVGFDPDHRQVRRALGQVRVEQAVLPPIQIIGQHVDDTAILDGDALLLAKLSAVDPNAAWFSPFDAQMIKRGLVWDPGLGWVYPRHRDRYEKGYIFDFDRNRWTSLAEANAFHSRRGHQWRIRTEHLLVQGTADLQSLAEVATRLEAFYAHVFGVYANFFADSRRVDALRLAMGLAEHRPLEINVFATADEYLQVTDAPQWAGGVFLPDEKASYFHGGASATMYHEFTHQILHVFSGKNQSPAWLTEGVAVYTQNPIFGAGGLTFHGSRYTAALSLDDILALRTGRAWDRLAVHGDLGVGAQYAAAGSLVTFCMEGDGGRYRDDFIDFLRDSYRGSERRGEVWRYLGLSRDEFEARYRAWGAAN